MPLPRWLGRFNYRVTNPIVAPAAARLPWFGVIEHLGRHTGHRYSTVVNVFHRDDRFVIALTYGKHSEWVENVLHAGECVLRTRGRSIRAAGPRRYHDPSRREVPGLVGAALWLLRVDWFLELRPASSASDGGLCRPRKQGGRSGA
jgi:deazaflavin-dependent oxidoreductase (nitroreductase family)